MSACKLSLSKNILIIAVICFVLEVRSSDVTSRKSPHIVIVLADDLGFNDVGFHGSSAIPTPNIDALAYSGIILNNYYVSPICTPSRSALMTGKHPVHLGTQHGVIYGAEPRGLNLTEKLMPQYLKELGYATHAVGKWHLGSWKLEYTPTFRGFDTHLGFWTGHQDLNDHTAMEKGTWGLDMRRNADIAYDLHGKYTTSMISEESVRIIKNHDPKAASPLFLYVAHAAVHSSNPYNPLPAPDNTVEKLEKTIPNYARRRFAAMARELDKSFGDLIEALEKRNFLNDTIIVFSSDNGGPAAGFNLNAASNYPLKGVKNTLWEGGVRSSGFIWSPRLKKTHRVSEQMMHITDWLPTLYTAAGGDSESTFRDFYGIDLWDALSENSESPREEILHNIDDVEGFSALRKGPWKIVKGTSYKGQWDNWYGPSERDSEYDIRSVLSSKTTKALGKINMPLTAKKILKSRSKATVECSNSEESKYCYPLAEDCLFHIEDDPCEKVNLAKKFPRILDELRERLRELNQTAVAPENLPIDPNGDPKNWGYVWTNFGDFLNGESIIN